MLAIIEKRDIEMIDERLDGQANASAIGRIAFDRVISLACDRTFSRIEKQVPERHGIRVGLHLEG